MTLREFLTNLTIILVVMAIGAFLEILAPMFADKPWKRGRRAANLGLTALSFASNWMLASAAAVAALTLRPAGLLAQRGLPFWVEVLIGILVLDFSVGYLSHRTMHMWPVMWRFHQIHHSDPFVDVTTTYRTHPMETVWRFLFAIVPIWLLGLPAEALLIQRMLQASNGILEHANIRLWAPLDRVLSLVWVTPSVHKIHHSRQARETNSNYANLLTIYDRVLGTYTPPERAESVVYGLDGAEALERASFGGLIVLPFRWRKNSGQDTIPEQSEGESMRTTVLVLLFAAAAAVMAHAATRKIDFSQDAVDQPPKGFEFGYTAGVGRPGRWVVQAEGTNRFLVQTDPDSTRSRFPVAVLSDVGAIDIDISVRFRPVSGRVDQAAGLVWRYQNQDNYYIVRANALEDNVVLYKVENGKRTDLPVKGEGRTYGKKAEVPTGQWSTLRVVASGPRFEVHFNGTKLYEVEDRTFTQAGKVGLWTKADSVTQFDDLTVVTQ